MLDNIDILPGDSGDPGGGGGVGGAAPPAPGSGEWAKIASYPDGKTGYRSVGLSGKNSGASLNGAYTALSVSPTEIVLSNPATSNPAWNKITVATAYTSAYLSTSGERWVGPFDTTLDDMDRMLQNVIAEQGLYWVDTKGKQHARTDSVMYELTPIDALGSPTGPPETFFASLTGSATDRDPLGRSTWCAPSFVGDCRIRARRISPTDLNKDNTVVDELRWRDSYAMSAVNQLHFGNVTTAHVRSYATQGATSVKERKINLNAQRMVAVRDGDGFSSDLAGSDNAADIICAMALDPFIGRRSVAELDVENIYGTVDEVADYFGSPLATQFGFTFDDNDVSFQEMAGTVGQTVFCAAYRQGRVLRLHFERATEDSTLILNARNILPGTMNRNIRFGPLDDNDGVQMDYVALKDGAPLSLSIPAGESKSPRKLEVQGVRQYQLAYWQAWRAWNKIRYQNIAVEVEATQEASLLIPGDRVLIADRTRPGELQGEVEAQDGTTLTLSDDAVLDPDVEFVIFLQHIDETTEALGVTSWVPGAGEDANTRKVLLSAMPRAALSLDDENFAKATYMIIRVGDAQTRACLVTERTPNSNFTDTVDASNYSFLFYQHDELVLWFNFETPDYLDTSAWRRDGIGSGGAATFPDPTRAKLVYSATAPGAAVTPAPFVMPATYTKAVWVKRPDLTAAGKLLANAHETFGFEAGPNLQAGHDGVHVSAPWPEAGVWHQALVTFDADGGDMVLYIDGKEVDSATGVPARTLLRPIAFTDYVGLADDVRLWKRALSADEVTAIYRASRLPGPPGSIGTEDGFAIGIEGGGTIGLE